MKFFHNNDTRLVGDTLRHRQKEWQVWYEGVPERIAFFYENWVRQHTANGRFWGNLTNDQKAEVLHMPLAGDIAGMGADLLFSEPIDVTYGGDEPNDRVKGFITENKISQRLLHSAEMCCALGGVYLKIDIDENEEFPILSVRYPSDVEGAFKPNGELKNVRFSRVFHEDGKAYRLYEKRWNERGGLAVGIEVYVVRDSGKDGKQISLQSLRHTENMSELVFYPDMKGLGAVYIPNTLPNKMFPESHEGISDFGQVISLLDSLDEAWTGWMNDLTLGRGRAFVDREILTESGMFDPNQKAFIKAEMSNANQGEGGKAVEVVQFAIRAQEHAMTCQSLSREIIMRCGYSPQSFGLDVDGQAESGTAIRLRERKTTLRRQRKARYWTGALEEIMYQMQQLDTKSGLHTGYQPEQVQVNLGDQIVYDPRETSETIRNLRGAESVSIQTAVSMAHPDWDEDAISKETERIRNESGMAGLPENMMGG